MIRNLSKHTLVAENFSFQKGFGKTKGLLFTAKAQPLVFRTRFGIHTFMMKYAIDLMVLSRSKKVVFLKRGVEPNRVVFWNPKFDLVLELPSGSIQKSKTELNDILELKL